MEVLVGMAIMGILCISGFYAFELVQKQHALYQQSNDRLYAYQHLLRLIESDINQSVHVNRSIEGWVCSRKTFDIHYRIQENSVIRFSNITPDLVDTFAVKIANLSASFRKKEKELGIIDQLSFHSSFNELQQQNTFTKTYSAFDLMSLEK